MFKRSLLLNFADQYRFAIGMKEAMKRHLIVLQQDLNLLQEAKVLKFKNLKSKGTQGIHIRKMLSILTSKKEHVDFHFPVSSGLT